MAHSVIFRACISPIDKISQQIHECKVIKSVPKYKRMSLRPTPQYVCKIEENLNFEKLGLETVRPCDVALTNDGVFGLGQTK